jgi:FixJ family two-component response regulator
MPGLSGLDLQKVLVAENSPTPIIFITAYPDATIRQIAMQAGAVEFLSKPFDGETLIECLEKVVGAPSPP